VQGPVYGMIVRAIVVRVESHDVTSRVAEDYSADGADMNC
jgi:hypothetical protein